MNTAKKQPHRDGPQPVTIDTLPAESPANDTRPRAVAAGTIFGHVDCYVLADGSTVLSQRGMLSGLRGDDGPEKGDLGRYLARLPEKYSALATDPNFEFVRPDGGVALGRPARDFVAMCRAYAEMYADGSIHKARVPLARNAIAILSMLAGRGLDEIIYEATGYRPVTAPVADIGAVLAQAITPIAQALSSVVTAQAVQMERLAKLEEKLLSGSFGGGVIPGGVAAAIRGRISKIAKTLARTRKAKYTSERTRIEQRIRSEVHWAGSGAAWLNLPADRLGDVRRVLDVMEREAAAEEARLGGGQQLSLLP